MGHFGSFFIFLWTCCELFQSRRYHWDVEKLFGNTLKFNEGDKYSFPSAELQVFSATTFFHLSHCSQLSHSNFLLQILLYHVASFLSVYSVYPEIKSKSTKKLSSFHLV